MIRRGPYGPSITSPSPMTDARIRSTSGDAPPWVSTGNHLQARHAPTISLVAATTGGEHAGDRDRLGRHPDRRVWAHGGVLHRRPRPDPGARGTGLRRARPAIGRHLRGVRP